MAFEKKNRLFMGHCSLGKSFVPMTPTTSGKVVTFAHICFPYMKEFFCQMFSTRTSQSKKRKKNKKEKKCMLH
jgi:hypothetical protein